MYEDVFSTSKCAQRYIKRLTFERATSFSSTSFASNPQIHTNKTVSFLFFSLKNKILSIIYALQLNI